MNMATVLGLIRHALTFGGGLAVGQGWVDDSTVQTVIAGLIALAGAIWSAVDKKQVAAAS